MNKEEKKLAPDITLFYNDGQKNFSDYVKESTNMIKSIERYQKKIDSTLSDYEKEYNKMTKTIERNQLKIDALISDYKSLDKKIRDYYRTVNTFIYDTNGEYCDIEPEFVLNYKVIEIIFDKVTKEISAWVGYNSIEEAADGQNVKIETVNRFMNEEYDLEDWQTYTFITPYTMYRLLKSKEQYVPMHLFGEATIQAIMKRRCMTLNKECEMNK